MTAATILLTKRVKLLADLSLPLNSKVLLRSLRQRPLAPFSLEGILYFKSSFLWDEGFHQLLIGAWDNDLSLDILRHWANLIDENGWVAREQILGDESRSKVPSEFQTQFPHFANPPTLIIALRKFIERLSLAQQGLYGLP